MTNGVPQPGWPPKACAMPDLSHLNHHKLLIVTLLKFVGNSGIPSWPEESCRINFVRVTDQMIREYKNAREKLLEYINSPPMTISPLLDATGHFESAVTDMKRAIGLAHRLRKSGQGPQIGQNILVLRHYALKRVRHVRDAIEHIYGGGGKRGKSRPNIPECLLLKDDRCELEGQQILYADFAAWIQQLDQLANSLANYKGP